MKDSRNTTVGISILHDVDSHWRPMKSHVVPGGHEISRTTPAFEIFERLLIEDLDSKTHLMDERQNYMKL